ncbi:hypothetical protein HanPI659440_Chr16g0647821 [Helianthus annuus]|nr:hypothetical protein HanPI659440_Chr16g0647821 [Helianthus annuus]
MLCGWVSYVNRSGKGRKTRVIDMPYFPHECWDANILHEWLFSLFFVEFCMSSNFFNPYLFLRYLRTTIDGFVCIFVFLV